MPPPVATENWDCEGTIWKARRLQNRTDRTGPALLSLIQRVTVACTQAEVFKVGFVFLSLLAVLLVVIHKDKGHSFRMLQKPEYEIMSVGCGWWKWWKLMGLGCSPPPVWWDLQRGALFPAEMSMDFPRLHKPLSCAVWKDLVVVEKFFFWRSLGKYWE